MTRIVVTGAAGFVGKHLLPRLDRKKYEIHALTTQEVPADDSGVCWHMLNLHNPMAREDLFFKVKPEILLHLAWYTEHGKYWSSSLNLEWVATSLEMLRNFQQAGGKRAVLLGTCAEYDWHFGFCSEKYTPRNPASLYGVAKNSLFETARKFAETSNFELAWGRVFFPYGPGEAKSRFISNIINGLRDGIEAKCSHGEQVRDFIYVKDLANAIISLMASNLCGAVNLGTGIPVKLADIALRIGQLMQRVESVRLGAIPAQENDPPLILADTTLLKESTGWRPEYPLDTGLQETIAYWQNHEK